MRRAVSAVLSDRMGFLRASAAYDVPKSTLERRVRKARNAENLDTDSDNDYGKKKLGRYRTVFTKEQENELAEYVKSMEARLFGITGKELRVLAYQLAEKNRIDHPFSEETGMAGEDWLSGFLKRHSDLTYRRPEPTSAARAMAFNKVTVNDFFSLLEKVIDQHKLTPDRIFNVDETGVSTVPKSHSRILSLKGQKQVGCLSSAERGQLVTAEICFNAAGTYVPPMLIYARKRMKNELLDDAPPGFWGTCSDNGWITSKIFLDWFKKFVVYSKPTEAKSVLLLLDGHASHTKNIDLIDYAREHHVILLCTPPHCAHKLQPLDVAFMRPLSIYYSAEVKKWLKEHPGRVVTAYQVAKLFGQAYLQAATMPTAINGFKKCGIWPLDKNVFTDADFIAAETTNTENLTTGDPNMANISELTNQPPTRVNQNQPGPSTSAVEAAQQSSATVTYNDNSPEHEMAYQVRTFPDVTLSSQNENLNERVSSQHEELHSDPVLPSNNINCDSNNGTSISNKTASDSILLTQNNIDSLGPTIKHPRLSTSKEKTPERQVMVATTSSFIVTPENIMAIPKEIRTQKRITRKRGKTAILTESPYKNDLINDINIKKSRSREIKTDKNKSDRKKTEKNKSNKKKPEVKKRKKNKTKLNKIASDTDTESSQDDENKDCACIYCGYLYSESTEGWVICSVCKGWAHNSCAGVDDDDEEAHTCERCLPD
ncbi:uncharacterized protein LOC113228920 [Hyposmocoma kahamanoa]|uniref:uncharacterized protein LOC113228920 n=1 Tax=Hyposmocoma kahamanoa TaxID=1477025 RepID=UPI000E6D886F|nr:uncharacterized protein LOC113228920 [Hyposmocoma kahamanoa]